MAEVGAGQTWLQELPELTGLAIRRVLCASPSLRLRREWCESVSPEVEGAMWLPDAIEVMFRLLLSADLRDCCEGSLPADVSRQHNTRIEGAHLLQVLQAVDISQPCGLEGDVQGEQETSGPRSSKTKSLMKICLTDGQQQVCAIELRPIELFCSVKHGDKIVLGNAPIVRRGLLLLEPKNVEGVFPRAADSPATSEISPHAAQAGNLGTLQNGFLAGGVQRPILHCSADQSRPSDSRTLSIHTHADASQNARAVSAFTQNKSGEPYTPIPQSAPSDSRTIAIQIHADAPQIAQAASSQNKSGEPSTTSNAVPCEKKQCVRALQNSDTFASRVQSTGSATQQSKEFKFVSASLGLEEELPPSFRDAMKSTQGAGGVRDEHASSRSSFTAFMEDLNSGDREPTEKIIENNLIVVPQGASAVLPGASNAFADEMLGEKDDVDLPIAEGIDTSPLGMSIRAGEQQLEVCEDVFVDTLKTPFRDRFVQEQTSEPARETLTPERPDRPPTIDDIRYCSATRSSDLGFVGKSLADGICQQDSLDQDEVSMSYDFLAQNTSQIVLANTEKGNQRVGIDDSIQGLEIDEEGLQLLGGSALF